MASGSLENLLSPSNETDVPSNPFAPSTPPTDLHNRHAFISEQSQSSNRTFPKFKRLSRNKLSPNSTRKPQFKGQLKPSPDDSDAVNGGVAANEGDQVNFEPSEVPENKPAKWNRKSMLVGVVSRCGLGLTCFLCTGHSGVSPTLGRVRNVNSCSRQSSHWR